MLRMCRRHTTALLCMCRSQWGLGISERWPLNSGETLSTKLVATRTLCRRMGYTKTKPHYRQPLEHWDAAQGQQEICPCELQLCGSHICLERDLKTCCSECNGILDMSCNCTISRIMSRNYWNFLSQYWESWEKKTKDNTHINVENVYCDTSM